nr:MAG TPA: hypothetical protein [Caudoviricetes sp.]
MRYNPTKHQPWCPCPMKADARAFCFLFAKK